MENLSTAIQSRQPLVVGSVGSHRALKLPIGDADCDLVELRLDTLGTGQDIRPICRESACFAPSPAYRTSPK